MRGHHIKKIFWNIFVQTTWSINPKCFPTYYKKVYFFTFKIQGGLHKNWKKNLRIQRKTGDISLAVGVKKGHTTALSHIGCAHKHG